MGWLCRLKCGALRLSAARARGRRTPALHTKQVLRESDLIAFAQTFTFYLFPFSTCTFSQATTYPRSWFISVQWKRFKRFTVRLFQKIGILFLELKFEVLKSNQYFLFGKQSKLLRKRKNKLMFFLIKCILLKQIVGVYFGGKSNHIFTL